MSVPRRTTAGARLARLGFADPAQAERLLTGLPELDDEMLSALAGAADPDLALAALARLPGDGQMYAALAGDPRLRTRLVAVLGASAALGDHLARHPGHWRVLRDRDGPRDRDGDRPGDGDGLRGGDGLGTPDPAEVRAGLLAAVGARADDAEPVAAPGDEPVTALRVAYRRRLLALAARDLTGEATLDQVAAELADLASAALEAALAIARAGLPPGAAPCRLAVIAMGKCGARELNYASDVDVIFVAEARGEAPGGDGPDGRPPGGQATSPGRAAGPADKAFDQVATGVGGAVRAGGHLQAGSGGIEAAALRTANQLAAGLIRVCSQSTPEGALFPVDPNLRPEGRNGPLVRTLASHRAYFDRWAQTWEFQALLKARPVAGDAALGQAYIADMAPLVWQAAQRENFVADVQAMRRRVIGTLPKATAGRELKLGPGGLRDIEFAVQLLQLVHGQVDETLREPATLPALAALAAGGYVGRDDAADLAAAYRLLRTVEHLLQLRNLRRTHTLPEDPAVLRRLGRALLTAEAGPGAVSHLGRPVPACPPTRRPPDPAQELLARWRQHAGQVQRLHEKLFYRPLLDAVARLPGDAVRLTPEAAGARLEALGYADPAGALRHIEALTSGVSRRAAIQRTLLPLMLGWFADAPAPDAGLLAFHQVSDALGNTPWYLRLLRDDMTVAQRMARLLASSRYATDLLLRQPETVAILSDDAQLAPREQTALRAEAAALIGRHAEAESAVNAVRGLRRRELLRTATADLLGRSDVAETGAALTTVAAVTVEAALQVSLRAVTENRGSMPTRVCVVAMGRFGGHESGYGSDADVMFVHDPLSGADEREATEAAHAVAELLRALLGRPAPDPPLLIDPGLRPEGRQGPLVRTLASYREYYRRWSVPWEAQALLRAEPAAGDAGLGERFTALIDQIRYPDGGLPDASAREIRRIKARMEAERMPRGVDPALHLKLGPGGLSDVEWTVQLLQLRHACAVPAMRTTRTLSGLAAAVAAGLAQAEDAAALAGAWRLASRIRDAVVLVRGRPSDVLPARSSELAAVASVLGYQPGTAQELVQDYRRAARRARTVMERIFYG